jgi:hypothetical protein
MVAKIINGKSIRGMLHYNENKVSEDKAHLIMANGFGADIENLIFHNKLQRFDNLTMLNEKVKTNALHICLSILSIIILQHLQHPYNCKSFS